MLSSYFYDWNNSLEKENQNLNQTERDLEFQITQSQA